MTELDTQIIHVESTVSAVNTEPCILIRWGEAEGMLTALEARLRAIAILKAATIAEYEARIFDALNAKQKRGFGKFSPSRGAIEILRFIRSCRPELPKDVEPIFGYNTQEPLVDLRWGSKRATLRLEEVRHHAQALLEASEAADSDAFFYSFFAEETDIKKETVASLIKEFALWRQRNQLKNLFNED